MSIFHEARPQSAYLKLGIYGEAGSGKSFTSSRVAIGLHRHIKSDKPVFYMDTETGSDYLRKKFDAEKVKLMVSKTRAFTKLVEAMDEIPIGAIVIVDSITHYWNELIESYMKKNQKTRLVLKDWQPLKATWREYSSRFVNSPLHIIVAGRSADKWDEVEDEDGAKELRKVGTKMRAEVEFGYEPSLLVEMQLFQFSARVGSALVHRAHVKKDRFDIINGQFFDDPGFESFLPHIQELNLGGEHQAIEPGQDSQAIFSDPNIGERRALNKEILCEKIANEMKKLVPGQTEKDKAERIKLMEQVFGTNSWTEISTLLKNDRLQAGLDVLTEKVAEVSTPTPEPVPVIPPVEKPMDGGNTKPKTKGARI